MHCKNSPGKEKSVFHVNRRWKLLRFLLAFMVVLAGIWGGFALWYQLPVSSLIRVGAISLFVLMSMAALRGLWRQCWKPPLLFGFILILMLGWWSTLKPSHDRIWADDVARLLHIEMNENKVRLDNVRHFDWRTDDDYTVRWESREYDLDKLVSADLVLSYWMGPAIAHTLVSFGFEDGEKLTFSVEIRKEKDESFSALGGFFRQFETVLIAADEQDIIRVRSNVRDEDVYLYRMQIPKEKLLSLFLGYVDEANKLEHNPSFYNTLTSNCTTVVFDIARAIHPQLPLDYRLLLSGYFAEYVYELKGLTPGYDYATLHARGRITERARALGNKPGFSEVIRTGIPGIPLSEQLQ